jgi:hypothetical protein
MPLFIPKLEEWVLTEQDVNAEVVASDEPVNAVLLVLLEP